MKAVYLTPLMGALAVALPAAFAPIQASAQSSFDNVDPNFTLRLSAFNPDAFVRLGLEGEATANDRTATYNDSAELRPGDEWRPHGEFIWHVGNRHNIIARYYDYKHDRSESWGGSMLDPGQVGEWLGVDPVEIPELQVNGKLDFQLASITYAYDLVQTERFAWNVGIGFAYAELEANINGQLGETAEVDAMSGVYRWKRTGLSPALHTGFTWTPSDRWMVSIDGQYMDTNWGDFLREDGHFERGGLLVEYAVTPRVGVHVGYDWFRLKLSDNYRGTIGTPDASFQDETLEDISYSGRARGQLKSHGPLAGITFKF